MVTTNELNLNRYLNQQKPVWNAIAILYAVLGYSVGLSSLFVANGWLNVLGVGLLSHGLIISAYLSHELMHGTLFGSRRWNVALGNVMLWLNGGCYARFDDLARIHIAHHINRVDFYRFDLTAFLNGLPAFVRQVLLGLEWLYIPSLAFLLRIRSAIAPFWDSDRQSERLRAIVILLVRASLFTAMAIASPKAVVLYFVAYVGMINVLRFVDAFQHTYESFPMGESLPQRDRAYEQANTFSNVVSLRHSWLNLLLLNFGYHNAHHELMKCPWHSLPELDRALFLGNEPHYITLGQLVRNYHRYRISRLYSGQGQALDAAGNQQLETFYGAIEVSFLVLPA